MPEHLLPYQRHLFLTFLTHMNWIVQPALMPRTGYRIERREGVTPHTICIFLTHLYPPTLACNRKSSKREVYAQLSELCGRSAVKRWWVTAQARLETSGARFYMGIERNEVFRINICHFKTSRVVVSLGQ